MIYLQIKIGRELIEMQVRRDLSLNKLFLLQIGIITGKNVMRFQNRFHSQNMLRKHELGGDE